jgi:hypothetical protein
VRCLCFNPDGERLFVGVRDYLKVVGWEPNRLFDSVPVNWSRVSDISIAQNQLVSLGGPNVLHNVYRMCFLFLQLHRSIPVKGEMSARRKFSSQIL